MANELRIEHLTHDAEKLAERRIDTLCHEVASARWYTEMLEAQAWVREFISKMAVPSLWLVAGSDRIADPGVTRAVHRRVRAPSAYREFPEMHHEVFNEVGREQAFELVRAFANEHLPG
jgi:alpha-beta hydrolase superfamily lysophospholipase